MFSEKDFTPTSSPLTGDSAVSLTDSVLKNSIAAAERCLDSFELKALCCVFIEIRDRTDNHNAHEEISGNAAAAMYNVQSNGTVVTHGANHYSYITDCSQVVATVAGPLLSTSKILSPRRP